MPKEAYVTMANKAVFIAHCLVLAESIREVGDDRDIVLLLFDAAEDSDTFLGIHSRAVDDLRIDVRRVKNPVCFENIAPNYKPFARRYYFDYVKLLAFNLTEYDRVLFMDGDMVVNRNLDEVFLSTPPPRAGGNTWIAASDGPYSPLNSGLVLIAPSSKDYDSLLKMVYEGNYAEPGGWEGVGGVHHGSSHTQGILPYYFQGRICKLPRTLYNNQVPADLPSDGFEAIRVVHFTGHGKPRVANVAGGNGGPANSDISRRAHDRWQGLWSRVQARVQK